MLYTIPDYYSSFNCIAGECPDTCCAGWQIVVDEASMKKYNRIRGKAGRRLRRRIDMRRGIFKQTQTKRCAFLNSRNLCDMYTEFGKRSLCRTCRLYPRHVEEFEGVREITFSLSCPVVADLLMGRMEPVKFLNYYKERKEEYGDFDVFLYSLLADAREVLYKIVQNRAVPILIREKLAVELACRLQERIDAGELFSCQEVLDDYCEMDKALQHLKEVKTEEGVSRFFFMIKLFRALNRLELLRDDWGSHIDETVSILYTKTEEEYKNIRTEFEQFIVEKLPTWEIQCEQLLVYFISTYFCGAVYDGRVSAKVKLAAVSRLLIEEMLAARWIKNERILYKEDITEAVYRYSREIEHSDRNLAAMERLMDRLPDSLLPNLTSFVSG